MNRRIRKIFDAFKGRGKRDREEMGLIKLIGPIGPMRPMGPTEVIGECFNSSVPSLELELEFLLLDSDVIRIKS